MFARMSLNFASKTRILQRFLHRGHVLKNVIEIRMPSLSPTMTQGNIVKWHKKEGDTISPGDLLCEIQTDKTIVGFEVEDEGTLARILKDESAKEVSVGTLIALIAEEGTDWKIVKVPVEISDDASGPKSTISASQAEVEKVHKSSALGPAAKGLLGQYDIDASKVESTGPHGILLKSDVVKYIKEKGLKLVKPLHVHEKPAMASQKAEAKSVPEVPFSKIETTPSSHTYTKMSIPHSYSSVNVCMDSVHKLCQEFKDEGLEVEYLDILIKAAAISLKTFPHLNVMWNDNSVKMLDRTNISFSIDVGGSSVICHIEDAASLPVEQISNKIKEFKENFQSKGSLESTVSSLLISYLGNVDITSYHGVVTPPHVFCLSFVAPRFILDENCSKRLQATVSMSVHSQVIDDAEATRFLESIKQMLETPSLMVSQHGYPVDISKLFAK